MNTSEGKVVYGFIFTFLFVLFSGISQLLIVIEPLEHVEIGYNQENAVL